MAVYTWSSGSAGAALWNVASNWSGGPANTTPGSGDVGLVVYGTVELPAPVLTGVAIDLAPAEFTSVALLASGVDLISTTITTLASKPPIGAIQFEVSGTDTLDASSTIEFAAAPLTIDLLSGATLFDNGTLAGNNLTIIRSGSATSLDNNGTITVSGPFTVAVGVTLDGTGAIDLGGAGADVTINGTVGAGQTIALTNTREIQTLTIGGSADLLGTISLLANQTIEVSATSESAFAGNVLSFSNGQTLTLAAAGGQTLQVFAQGSATEIVSSGTLLSSAACYCAGTRIATAAGGDALVEELREGDVLALARGGVARVTWVGCRAVRCDNHPEPANVWPVRIRAGAFADGVPSRDLLLSPDHAVAFRAHLIPVRHLTNGATIVQERVAIARYHHVELARHDLLLAEGLAAESYLDTGNRASFADDETAPAPRPDLSRRIWARAGCLPLVEDGPVLLAARRALLRRAGLLGHRRTRDPALRVLADGRDVRPRRLADRWVVTLPADARSVRLCSRVWVPAEMRPEADDSRRLGVAVGRLWLDRREVSLDSPALSAGWHAPEPDGRWTDGDAELPVAGARDLAFAVTMAGSYWRA